MSPYMIQSLIIHIIRGLVRVIKRMSTSLLGKQEKMLIRSKLVGGTIKSKL